MSKYKIVLGGSTTSGKSSLYENAIAGSFTPNKEATKGVEFTSLDYIKLGQDKNTPSEKRDKIAIWDEVNPFFRQFLVKTKRVLLAPVG